MEYGLIWNKVIGYFLPITFLSAFDKILVNLCFFYLVRTLAPMSNGLRRDKHLL